MDRNDSNDRTTAGVIAATVIIASIALPAIAGLTGSICAAGGENAGESEGEVTGAAVSAASVTTSINYQGRLTDSSGSPLSGTYEITFRLYDVSTGGTALATDTHDVDVADGLFNTGTDFDQSYFDGRELWLGVTVGTDSEMAPRQELRPVPYALSLVPGADIIGSAPVALHAESTHTSGRGIRGYATATSGANYGMVGASKSPDGYGGYFYNNGGGIGMYGKGGDYGGFFTTDRGGTGGLYPVHNAAVNATTTHDYSDGVHTKTTGYGSAGVRAYTTGGNSPGFYTSTIGDKSWGVRIDTSGDESHGVCARTDGSDSDGVWAYSVNHYGVYARSDSTGSAGVYALGRDSGADLILGGNADTTVGDDGKIYSDPAYDSSDISLISNDNIRIDLNNDGNDEDADFEIYDKDNTLIFNVDDSGTTTVRGKDSNADLILGGNADTTVGDDGKIYSDPAYDSSDIFLITNDCLRIDLNNDGNDEDADFEIYDKDNTLIFNVDDSGTTTVRGNLIVKSSSTGSKIIELGEGLDYAEGFDVSDKTEIVPGTVLIIDPDNPGKLTISDTPYDAKVAGIVAGARGMGSGVRLGADQFDYDVALAGRVYCNVDATEEGVEPGDMLTTSATPGYAMKSTDYKRARGAILGKAMERLEKGEKGQILVLVTLQ